MIITTVGYVLLCFSTMVAQPQQHSIEFFNGNYNEIHKVNEEGWGEADYVLYDNSTAIATCYREEESKKIVIDGVEYIRADMCKY